MVILVGQLPKLFGFSTDADGLVAESVAFLQGVADGLTNPWALGIGLLSLAIILGLKRLMPRAPGILVAVVVAIVLSVILDLAARGVSVIGVLPQGFPLPSIPAVDPADLPLLLAGAVGISLVAIGDTISTSGGFAARAGYELDGNQELAGIGSANLAAGFFSGFPVTTSSSRTAVALQSGARTQLTGLVAAALVLAMLVLVPGLVQAMPQPVLAAVVIAASISLFDAAGLRWLYRVRRSEFVAGARLHPGRGLPGRAAGHRGGRAALRGLDLPAGLVTALGGAGQAARRPRLARRGALRGRAAGPRHAHRALVGAALLRQRHAVPGPHPRARGGRRPGASAGSSSRPSPSRTSTRPPARMLIELHAELSAAGIHFAFAELQTAVREAIAGYRRPDDPKAWHFYASVTEAVEAFQQERAREGDGEASVSPRRVSRSSAARR